MKPEMKDFFVSYNKADKAWAEWTAWLLEDAGYSVLIQVWDFRPGENFVLEMQKATMGCKKTIVILSKNYLNSSYTQPEWAAAFAVDPQGQHQQLIPILVEPCEPKGLLATLIYVDIVGVSEQDARLAILGAFSTRAKPSHPPAFPGGDETQQTHVPYPGEARSLDKASITDSIITTGDNNGVLMATLQPHLTSVTNATISMAERLQLAQDLNAIPPQQFNIIVFALDPPAGLIPPMPAPQADRVNALLEWAKGSRDCSLAEVQKLLAELLKPGGQHQRTIESRLPKPEDSVPRPQAIFKTGPSQPGDWAESTVELDQADVATEDETDASPQLETVSSSEAAAEIPSPPEPRPLISSLLAKAVKRVRSFVGKLRKRNPIIAKLKFPRRLTTWKLEEVKLVFAKHLKYAKVEFAIDNPHIEVWYNNVVVAKPIFSFNFSTDDFTQIFQLRLKEIEKNVIQPVTLNCLDVKNKVRAREGRFIKLKCRTGFPTSPWGLLNILPWAIEHISYAAWYVTYPAIAGFLIVSYVVIPVLFPTQVTDATHKIENVMITVGVWPARKDQWNDNFDLTQDGKWMKEADWEYPAGKWKVLEEPIPPQITVEEEAGKESIHKRGFLHINGSGLAIYKRPGGDAFYDFELEFIAVLPPDKERRVTWLVRADEDSGQWYEFELVKKSNNFRLNGYSYSGGKRTALKGADEAFDLPDCCRQGDQIRVRGVIKDYEFTHWVAVENPHEVDPPRLTLGDEHPPKGLTLRAEWKWFRFRYRYGSFGFRGTSDGDEAQIIYVHTKPLVR